LGRYPIREITANIAPNFAARYSTFLHLHRELPEILRQELLEALLKDLHRVLLIALGTAVVVVRGDD
jgi:hypothetical protein